MLKKVGWEWSLTKFLWTKIFACSHSDPRHALCMPTVYANAAQTQKRVLLRTPSVFVKQHRHLDPRVNSETQTCGLDSTLEVRHP